MAIKENALPVGATSGPGTYIRTVNSGGESQRTAFDVVKGAITEDMDSAIEAAVEAEATARQDADDALQDEIDSKVDKVTGKGLSTNDFTTTEKNKLAGIAAGAQVNTIETVKVNGTALVPDANKAVDIPAPVVDNELDATSENPVQNKVIAAEITDLKEDYDALETRVSTIEDEEGLHRYGVSGIGQSANQLTRLWDAVGMTAQVGTDGDNSNVINNFDDVTPFNRRKCVGTWTGNGDHAVFHVHAYYGDEDYAEDGSKGDYVAVECPRAFYHLKNGVLGVSAHQYPEWRPFDIFCRSHDPEDTIPYVYLPAYALALDEDGHAVSLPGYDNEQGTYKGLLDAARTYKGGELGNLAMLQPAAVNFYEWALFTVEFARQDAQTVMYGCGTLRHSNDDRATFVDATHVITNNYQAARVPMECVAIVATSVDQNSYAHQATHRIVSITRCDAEGNADASGTHQLVALEDLGKGYYDYDTTGATEYKFVARPYRTGDCNGVSTPSGSPVSNTNGYYPMRYRWRENVYGNQYKTIMDLFNKRVGTGDSDWMLEWYFLPDPTSYEPSGTSKPDSADLATDLFELLDIETAHGNYANGYIKSVKRSEEYPDLWIPYETSGGSASTYFADYAYLVLSSPVRSVRLGGIWSHGRAAGFSSVYGTYAPSSGSAIFGGDLLLAQ